jgi:hypothetical protein
MLSAAMSKNAPDLPGSPIFPGKTLSLTTEHPANGSFRHEPKENMVKPHG